MRRKSERTASKKTKPSPEKKEKVEKTKRTRTRRTRKHSSSSESESAEEPPKVETAPVSEVESKDPPKPVKEDSPEEAQEQVWHVKATETSGDVGEIQKLKICLARPPSTPERPDRSPRSKRKHSRATSSSDTQSVEGDEKKKSKHRSRRGTSDTKTDCQGDEAEAEKQIQPEATPESSEPQPESKTEKVTESVTKLESAEEGKSDLCKMESKPEKVKADSGKTDKSDTINDETPMSTTSDDTKEDKAASNTSDEKKSQNEGSKEEKDKDQSSDADTTVVSPKPHEDEKEPANSSPKQESPKRERSVSADEKSEVLELHPDESRCESTERNLNESQEVDSKTAAKLDEQPSEVVSSEVSINQSTTEISGTTQTTSEKLVTTNKNDVVESTKNVETEKATISSKDSDKDKVSDDASASPKEKANSSSGQEVQNGPATPLVINRKRRWGSRPSKLSNQKSITISTDVLKEIIPDVKPAEFDEVIEEKKHKRVEVPERFDRPVLPKIVIDNTENVEMNKKEQKSEDKDKENIKMRDSQLSLTRKISIVKDNDSILTRPPSPPRHKQSNILYITNLVRPFTLPQLKNLLQRTGRIVENGFWIDRIKSKCFVKYETEDQAVETRHALHGVTWPVSNPKTLHVDFSVQEDFDKAKANEDTDNAQASTIPGTVEDWLREQDMKREKGELEKPWERKAAMREWDVGKNEKGKDQGRPDKIQRDDRLMEKRRPHRTPERSPEPARKFKKKEEEAPAKLLDDLFRKTKTTPCIYWLPLSAETIAIKEEQRRQHMAEHERRLQELRRTHRRH